MQVDIRDKEMRELQACAAGDPTTSGSQPAMLTTCAAGPSLSTSLSGFDAGEEYLGAKSGGVASLEDEEGGVEGNTRTSGSSGISGDSGMELFMQIKECCTIGELQEVPL